MLLQFFLWYPHFDNLIRELFNDLEQYVFYEIAILSYGLGVVFSVKVPFWLRKVNIGLMWFCSRHFHFGHAILRMVWHDDFSRELPFWTFCFEDGKCKSIHETAILTNLVWWIVGLRTFDGLFAIFRELLI